MNGTPVRRFSTDFAFAKSLIGATPLWLAAKFGESEMMRVLLDHGAELHFAMADGTTPLMIAISAGAGQDRRDRMFMQPEVMTRARAREPVVTLEAVTVLLDAGADVNAVSESGDTALHRAAGRRLDAVVQVLADRGATLDVKNKRGQTPLGRRVHPGPGRRWGEHGRPLTTPGRFRRSLLARHRRANPAHDDVRRRSHDQGDQHTPDVQQARLRVHTIM